MPVAVFGIIKYDKKKILGIFMQDELLEEEKKLRKLRFIVDFAINFIMTQDITHDDAMAIIEGVRKNALKLFPGKDDAFDIIYAPRFKRILNEKFKRS